MTDSMVGQGRINHQIELTFLVFSHFDLLVLFSEWPGEKLRAGGTKPIGKKG